MQERQLCFHIIWATLSKYYICHCWHLHSQFVPSGFIFWFFFTWFSENQIWFGTRREAKISFSSTRHMFSTLRQYVSTGNPLWGLRPPHNAPTYDQQPHSTSFFSYKDPGNLSMAIFFLSWYSSILTSYANQVLSVASSTFSGGVSLFGKLPLLYPWPRLRSYPYELTAGLYSSNGHDMSTIRGNRRDLCKSIKFLILENLH